MPSIDDSHEACLNLLEGLGRVTASVNSGLDLGSVLQSIVDAIADHTDWQICWISAVDFATNSSEVVARRDRLDYSTKGTSVTWPLDGLPALHAIQRGSPIVIEDAQRCQEFPDYAKDARQRGYVCGVVIHLESPDPAGRPVVLSVQSKSQLLPDERQLHFLRSVSKIVSLAIRSANIDARARQMFADLSRTVMTHTNVVNAVGAGENAWHSLDLVQRTHQHAIVVVDRDEAIVYCGRSPIPDQLDDEAWRDVVREHKGALLRLAAPPGSSPGTAGTIAGDVPMDGDLYVRAEQIGDPVVIGTLLLLSATPLPDDAALALSLLRSSVAVALVREHVRQETETKLGETAIELLLRGDWVRPEEIIQRAAHTGIDLLSGYWVGAMASDPGPDDEPLLVRMVQAELDRLDRARVARTSQGYALLIPATVCAERLEHGLHRIIERIGAQLRRPVSIAVSGPCDEIESYAPAWLDCQEANQLASTLGREGIVRLEDFGAYRFLLSATQQAEVDAFIARTIGPVIDYDTRSGSDLVHTAEAFVSSGGRFQETARELNVHVSTLRYRLGRVEELLSRDLANQETRFEITLATRLHALRQQGPTTEP